MRRGGNAVDAAIAVSYAVCVLNASSCGVGGGGFMLINEPNGHVHALDYREVAPALAHRDLFRRDAAVLSQLSSRGPLAVAVPGEIAGLEAARARFARLPRRELMAPAIALARDGFPIGEHLAGAIAGTVAALRQEPALAARLLHPDGTPLRSGEIVRFPELAATLEGVAEHGADAFYRGRVAEQIAGAVQARNGILTTDDLARYRPIWREPLRATYRGLEILTVPPPSSGGVILEILAILGRDDLAALGGTSPAYLHLLAEAMKHGFADRARWYGDPAFTKVPVARLTSASYAAALRARIRDDATLAADQYGSTPDHGTSHLSVMDADGGAVACTTTINTTFGAMLVGGDTGVILNNEMDDFSIAPGVPNTFGLIGGDANAVGPRKRPLSSMCPVIVRKAGRPTLVAGGSGGPLIISGTLETLLGVIDFGLDGAAAVAAPRIHTQWMPPVLFVEPAIPTGHPRRPRQARPHHSRNVVPERRSGRDAEPRSLRRRRRSAQRRRRCDVVSARGLALVVATRDRAAMLRRLLVSALAMDALANVAPEIVVVDDGSGDRTRLVVADVAARYAGTRYLRAVGRGKAAALNAGIRASQASILAFLDDDVELDACWLVAVDAYFSRHDVAAAQGTIRLPIEAAADPAVAAAVERWRTIPRCDLGPHAAECGSLIGANMLVTRATFARVGLFDERLGPGASGACEDTELAERIQASGGQLGYIPDAIVYHAVDPERLTADYFRILHARRGRSRVYYKRGATPLRILPNLGKAALGMATASLIGGREMHTRALGRWYHYRAMLAARHERGRARWTAAAASELSDDAARLDRHPGP